MHECTIQDATGLLHARQCHAEELVDGLVDHPHRRPHAQVLHCKPHNKLVASYITSTSQQHDSMQHAHAINPMNATTHACKKLRVIFLDVTTRREFFAPLSASSGMLAHAADKSAACSENAI